MTTQTKIENIQTKIWNEEPEKDNPFVAAACHCHGYDVYGDLLGKASWIEYLYILFRGEQPTTNQAKLLEGLAIALANPGPRDHSVRAAMNAGVGGGASASCLIAATGVGAGSFGGSREVYCAISLWEQCNQSLDKWENYLKNPPKKEKEDVWTEIEHPPGFDPYGSSCATPVRQTLEYLTQYSEASTLPWLLKNRVQLEAIKDVPLAMCGVAAATLYDLGFTAKQGEMLYLLLRLPGAAVHALEQRTSGWRKYPLFMNSVELLNDPGPKPTSPNAEDS